MPVDMITANDVHYLNVLYEFLLFIFVAGEASIPNMVQLILYYFAKGEKLWLQPKNHSAF